MRTIVKLTIILGLILQGSPVGSFSYGGFVWREDVQEDVHLQTVTYRVGWPMVYIEAVETTEYGHLWEEVTSKTITVRPHLGLLSAGFWLVLLWLLDMFWPMRKRGIIND